MEPLEIIILIGAIALVVFTVVFNIVRKLRGKSSCGCDSKSSSDCGGCGGCPYSGQCGKAEKHEE